jgi:hypothetical protein
MAIYRGLLQSVVITGGQGGGHWPLVGGGDVGGGVVGGGTGGMTGGGVDPTGG